MSAKIPQKETDDDALLWEGTLSYDSQPPPVFGKSRDLSEAVGYLRCAYDALCIARTRYERVLWNEPGDRQWRSLFRVERLLQEAIEEIKSPSV